MAKKRESKKQARGAKSEQLGKRLRKAEDQLQEATAKRDRAQARVEALAIIADELRAQLAELERPETAATQDTTTAEDGESTRAAKRPAASRASSGITIRAKKKPAAAKDSPVEDAPEAAEAMARASSS